MTATPSLPLIDTTLFRDSLHLPTRSLFLYGEVCPAMTDFVAKGLHLLDIFPKEPITIYLSSPGGDIADSLAIYDLIRACRAQVRIIGHGEIMSGGSVILQAGDWRFLRPHASVMIHQAAAGVSGMSLDDLTSFAKATAQQENAMFAIYADQLNKTVKQIKELCRRDTYFTARQAIKIGLADGIFR